MPEVSVPSTSASVDQLASFRSEIDALHESDVLTPRVDIAAAALVALGARPNIDLHRAAVNAVFGEAGNRTIDRLQVLARGLMLAQAITTATTAEDLEPMAQEVMGLRNSLHLAASALVERGLVSRKSLGELIGGQSYQARVTDTGALVSWFLSLPSAVRAQTKVTDLELARAREMAEELGIACAARDQARAGSSRVLRDRARMFTLFFRTYQRVRQMLSFVRWHEDDLEQIAPSLYAGRRTRRRSERVDGPELVSPSPLAPSPAPSPDMPGGDPFRTT